MTDKYKNNIYFNCSLADAWQTYLKCPQLVFTAVQTQIFGSRFFCSLIREFKENSKGNLTCINLIFTFIIFKNRQYFNFEQLQVTCLTIWFCSRRREATFLCCLRFFVPKQAYFVSSLIVNGNVCGEELENMKS